MVTLPLYTLSEVETVTQSVVDVKLLLVVAFK